MFSSCTVALGSFGAIVEPRLYGPVSRRREWITRATEPTSIGLLELCHYAGQAAVGTSWPLSNNAIMPPNEVVA